MKDNKYDRDFLEMAHNRSIFHEIEIKNSRFCGCFYCGSVFESKEIVEWTDEDNPQGKTAPCPKCGIDAVLSDKLPIQDKTFLKKMHRKYF